MTESEWLECTDPYRMLDWLRGKIAGRKLRLFFCACLRSSTVSPLLTSKSSHRAVEVGERYADGLANVREMKLAQSAAHGAFMRVRSAEGSVQCGAAFLALELAHQDANLLRFGLDGFMGLIRSKDRLPVPANLVREVWGNLFRPITINPIWLTQSVTSLAQAAYEERMMPSGELDTARLAVLSDALEEAGCDDADILNHLRSPGPHVRGCWVVDLVLGKQ